MRTSGQFSRGFIALVRPGGYIPVPEAAYRTVNGAEDKPWVLFLG